ncbi:MAG: hypothetical protein H6607_04380 [Flavobacteriales bacterium]|nr:hypothetical protein [Flavobacteriales bacterium]
MANIANGQCTTPAPTAAEVCEEGKGISTNPISPVNCEGADNNGTVKI